MISVIIPCFNAEKYIAECLDSVLKQTYKDFEILCVDNNSTDSTRDRIQEYVNKFPEKIRLLEEKNSGASIARNTGFRNSSGDIIQFLDADDILDKNKFEKQVSVFRYKDADVVVSDRIVKNENLSQEINRFMFDKIEANPLEMAVTQVIITGNPLYKRTIVEKVNGYDETLESAQDWDFHIRLVIEGAKFAYEPGYFLISRQVANSLSSNWLKVSNSAAEKLEELKMKIIETGLVTDKILYRIHSIFYNSAIRTEDENDLNTYISEIKFWLAFKNYSNLKGFKKLLSKIFGYKNLIFFEKLRIK